MSKSNLIASFKRRLASDSLFRNSVYLMGSTFVVAGSGFFYWIFAAHMYQAKAVGLAATFIAISNVVMILSLMGYDNSFIRFLPKAKNKNTQIDTGFTVSIIVAIITSLVYLAAIYAFIPGLSIATSSLLWMGFFVFFMVVSMLNYLSNYPFVAFRITCYVLLINTGMGIFRLVLLPLFTGLGLVGLLLSNIIALATALAATLYFMKLKMNYTFHPRIDFKELRATWRYGFNSYASIVFLTLPAYILPTFVVGKLGAVSSGHYYIVAVIIAALNVIPQATSQSLFAEGVWDNNEIKQHLFKATKIVYVLTLPAVLVLALGGKLILEIFGSGYASSGYTLLIVLSVSMLFKAGSFLLSTVLRVEHRVSWVAITYAIYATILLGGSYIGMQGGHGLVSIGWATLGAEFVTLTLFIAAYRLRSTRTALA